MVVVRPCRAWGITQGVQLAITVLLIHGSIVLAQPVIAFMARARLLDPTFLTWEANVMPHGCAV